MAKLFEIPSIEDNRGILFVIDKILPFEIKRIFYIMKTPMEIERGGHRHKTTKMALIAINGSCEIFVNDGNEKTVFTLSKPSNGLILDPKDWHTMKKFVKGTILLVIASTNYDADDYIHEEY